MGKIEVRKTIALSMAAAYIIFTGYCIIAGKPFPSEFSVVVGSIIGYYFGKSTALETTSPQSIAVSENQVEG